MLGMALLGIGGTFKLVFAEIAEAITSAMILYYAPLDILPALVVAFFCCPAKPLRSHSI